MLFKVDTPLKTMDGQVMKDADSQGNAVDATLKMAIVNAVLSPVPKESGIDKVKKYELARKVYSSDEVELSSEEITLIKERVGEIYPPLVVGQVHELLNV